MLRLDGKTKDTKQRKKKQFKLKPFKIPPGLIVIQDTREQAPLFTRPPRGLVIKTDTLHVGDYSIDGFQDKFCCERKQMSDFYGFIGAERNKTVLKIQTMAEFEFACLIIEASERTVLSGHRYSQASPEVARGFLNSIRVRYGIHTYMSANKQDCMRFLLDSMIKYYNTKREVR